MATYMECDGLRGGWLSAFERNEAQRAAEAAALGLPKHHPDRIGPANADSEAPMAERRYGNPGKPDPLKPALERQEGGGHYKGMAIQPFTYIHANGLPFAEGCVVKYVSRWRAKGGVEDLRKARHFLDLLIEAEQNAQTRSAS